MTARGESLASRSGTRLVIRDGEVVKPREEEPPRVLARGSSRVVTKDVTHDLPLREPHEVRRESTRDLARRDDTRRASTHRGLARRDPTLLAVAFLAAYLGQAVMRLDFAWLAALQRIETFKLATGAVLVVYIALQWLLARRSREVHVWLGVFAPVVLYAHAAHFAYGYLVWLAIVYIGVGAVGLAHRPIISHRARRLFIAWFITHLALSVVLIVLAAYHVVIVFAYE